ELVENALDAGATRVSVKLVAAGRRLIEVQDNGHGMNEQNALLAIERHATSKIRNAQDLDNIHTLGFRGEALASIAAVSRFVLVTRRRGDESATQLRVDGGILREVRQVGAPEGTRISVNRLYFNTPVRAKFLKGITTELGHCIDIVQQHALAHPEVRDSPLGDSPGVAFQFIHNDRMLLDVPEHATLRDRIALIWGLAFARDVLDIAGEQNGFTFSGLAGLPGLNRSNRQHQFFFVNGRPVVNRSLQYGFADAYRGLLTVGRHPVGVLNVVLNPRQVDVNIHPTKREIRFRDERAAHDAARDVVRQCLAEYQRQQQSPMPTRADAPPVAAYKEESYSETEHNAPVAASVAAPGATAAPFELEPEREWETRDLPGLERARAARAAEGAAAESEEQRGRDAASTLAPTGFFESVRDMGDAPLQVFDTYLIVPEESRLLIIDQHALHERLNYDALIAELEDNDYASQQLAVPVVFEVAPSQTELLETNLPLFAAMGIEIEPFGGNTFQITSVCHLYEESKAPDVVYGVLDELAQGNLFDSDNAKADLLRIATRACKASVKAGDPLTTDERRSLLAGFRRLRPPYTCPHGRPIIVELTQHQMEKSFRRIQ
ncbi:MAG TPA: DNA mismatch repair endonuclease MutL, partial [Candidatus Hydrogenedentes bacterium]|nr:DNA mismatch repair endonuclease MutL [Candidatus Hydrogenedentota bacterium]